MELNNLQEQPRLVKVDEKYNVPLLFTESTSMAFDTLSSLWNPMVDGQSSIIKNPNPYLAKFSIKYSESLLMRVILFSDELALWMLQENVGHFFYNK